MDIIDCRFIDNTATLSSDYSGDGGAIWTGGGGSMVVTRSTLEGNTAKDRAPHIFKYSGDVTCDDGNTFNNPTGGNSDHFDGPGLCVP